MDYWKECIKEALDDVLIIASEGEIDTIASWVEGAHENYSTAMGHDVNQSPVETEKDRIINSLKAEIKNLENNVFSYRQSVATRRNVPVEDVYLEDGDVIYGKSL